jgi:hypothetical protein
MTSIQPSDRTLFEKVEAAFDRVAESLIRTARQTNTPLVVWKDGQITEVSPDEAEADLAEAEQQAQQAAAGLGETQQQSP